VSSTAYFAEIHPDPFLRRVVLTSGALLALAGVPLIFALPVAAGIRVAAACLWLALAGNELSRARQAWNSCHALRFFADGTVVALVPGQAWQPATLLPGGILLSKVGWIRLSVALPTGRKLVLQEFLRGDGHRSVDWRRLQVIWRHIGA
jgi:hypothetical protein